MQKLAQQFNLPYLCTIKAQQWCGAKKTNSMKTIKIFVKRAQSYATVRDSGSYNYRFSQTLSLESEDGIWWKTMCQTHEAREEFFKFLRTGAAPNFSGAIKNVQAWLDEHGHKEGAWLGAVANYSKDLEFLKGGYKAFASMYQPAKVEYFVETLPAYSLGTFDKQIGGKHIPFPSGNPESFTYTEQGFLHK